MPGGRYPWAVRAGGPLLGGGVFVPTDLPGLIQWSDATLGTYDQTDPNFPEWQDLSTEGADNPWIGNGFGTRTPSQGTEDGIDTLIYDGVDDHLRLSTHFSLATVTIFFLMKILVASNAQKMMGASTAGETDTLNFFAIRQLATGTAFELTGKGADANSMAIARTDAVIFRWGILTFDNTTYTYYDKAGSSSDTATTAMGIPTDVIIGAGVASNGNQLSPSNCAISSVGFYNRVLSASEITQLGSYLTSLEP